MHERIHAIHRMQLTKSFHVICRCRQGIRPNYDYADIPAEQSTLPKSKTPAYIKQNLETFDFTLSDAQMRELEAMATGFRFGGQLP